MSHRFNANCHNMSSLVSYLLSLFIESPRFSLSFASNVMCISKIAHKDDNGRDYEQRDSYQCDIDPKVISNGSKNSKSFFKQNQQK